MLEADPRETTPRSPSGIEVMSSEDCLTFLAETTTVGRVAFRSSNGQEILPVNFIFKRDRVYFMTSPDSVLAELAEGRDDVAFEIDYPDRLMQHGWSVLVKGTTKKVSSSYVDLWAKKPQPWAAGVRDLLIELTPDQITGRRIRNPR